MVAIRSNKVALGNPKTKYNLHLTLWDRTCQNNGLEAIFNSFENGY